MNKIKRFLLISASGIAALFCAAWLALFLSVSSDSIESQYRREVSQHPENLGKALRLASYLRTDGQLKESATIYEKILAQHPDALSAYYHLGQIYMAEGRSTEAVKLWQDITVKTENANDRYSVSWRKAAVQQLGQVKGKLYS